MFLRALNAAALQAVLKLITFYSSVASTTPQHTLKYAHALYGADAAHE